MHNRRGRGKGKATAKATTTTTTTPTRSTGFGAPSFGRGRGAPLKKRTTDQAQMNAHGGRKMTGFRVEDALFDVGEEYQPDLRKQEDLNDYLDGLGGWEDAEEAKYVDSRFGADIDWGKIKSCDPKDLYAPVEHDLTEAEKEGCFRCTHEGGVDGVVLDSKRLLALFRSRNQEVISTTTTTATMTTTTTATATSRNGGNNDKRRETVLFLSKRPNRRGECRTSSVYLRKAKHLDKVDLGVNPYVFFKRALPLLFPLVEEEEDGDGDHGKPQMCNVGVILSPPRRHVAIDDGRQVNKARTVTRRFCSSELFTNLKRFFEDSLSAETFRNHSAMKDKLISSLKKDHKEAKCFLPIVYSDDVDDREEEEQQEPMDPRLSKRETMCHLWEKVLPLDHMLPTTGVAGDDDDDDDYGGRFRLYVYVFSYAPLIEALLKEDVDDVGRVDAAAKASASTQKRRLQQQQRRRKYETRGFLDQLDKGDRLEREKEASYRSETSSTAATMADQIECSLLHLLGDEERNQEVRLYCVFFILKQQR